MQAFGNLGRYVNVLIIKTVKSVNALTDYLKTISVLT